MAELKQVLTNRDLKKMFNVSKTTIYNWRKGGLKFFKIGGNGLSDPVRYNLSDIQDFCDKTGRKIINPIYEP